MGQPFGVVYVSYCPLPLLWIGWATFFEGAVGFYGLAVQSHAHVSNGPYN